MCWRTNHHVLNLELACFPVQNVAWTRSPDNQVNAYREGKELDEIVIERIDQRPGESPVMQKDYKQDSVQAAWDNHFSAFGAQDVNQIMQDYTEQSVLKAFDHTTGVMLTAKGLDQIAQFFADLFATLADTSALAAPVIKIMEGTSTLDGSVYLIWSCTSSGITSATDTFIHSADNKIIRQNIAYTSDPNFRAKTTTKATETPPRPATTSKFNSSHTCDTMFLLP